MWWLWALGGLVTWFVVGALAAVVIGKAISLGDRRSATALASRPADARRLAVVSAGDALPATGRRLQIPLPPFAVALVALAVALQTAGYVLGLRRASGQVAQLLSMDAPFSVPRMYVAALFGAAALAAVTGAGTIPGRRTWWLAVGGVAGIVCAIKAGSTLHATAMAELSAVVTLPGAVLISSALAGAVVTGLWVLSRNDERDRKRVLSALALYAAASVGLSAVSSALANAFGSAAGWTLAATYLEETGEALAAVTMLVAVLVGVAPQVVLPTAWALRRTADEHTLQVPEASPLAARPWQG